MTDPSSPPLRTWRPMAAWTAGILLALGLAWLLAAVLLSSRYESGKLVASWRSTGRPGCVEGTVVDSRGVPVAGLSVATDDTSGGQIRETDKDGRFSIEAGEGEIIALNIEGVESIRPWAWRMLGLSTQKGLWFDIQLRCKEPPK